MRLRIGAAGCCPWSGTQGSVNANTLDDGFCAVVDIWGANPNAAPGPLNPLDQVPEVVTITGGLVQVLNGQTGQLIHSQHIGSGSRGGPPNVDDFDGDGFPEVGTAGSASYAMLDFQAASDACPAWTVTPGDDGTSLTSVNPPRITPGATCTQDSDCGDMGQYACHEDIGACVCLHNGWMRTTEDDSSQVTGSSVFDFNGDGRAEVVYNDECRFRIYDGLNGDVYMREPSESRTRVEYPVIADVDNDGNAEIVFSTTNESGFCSQNLDGQYNNGIEVWGDASDFWVPARRIWNQHTYHVTNVLEDGGIPLFEPDSWVDFGDRQHNLYRSQPRSRGVAPDLTVTDIQVASAECGRLEDAVDIIVRVENQGDVRVGPGVVIAFYGIWNASGLDTPLYADAAMTPLTFALTLPLQPGQSILVTVTYDAANNAPGTLPTRSASSQTTPWPSVSASRPTTSGPSRSTPAARSL